jgi:hypothetical protein
MEVSMIMGLSKQYTELRLVNLGETKNPKRTRHPMIVSCMGMHPIGDHRPIARLCSAWPEGEGMCEARKHNLISTKLCYS